MSTSAPTQTITNRVFALRPADHHDVPAVRRLAALDSAPVPAAPYMLGIVDGEIRAAVSLTTGAVVADPFVPTAALVELLVLRAARLHDGTSVGLLQRARATLPVGRHHGRTVVSH